jgi:hypothetical protein
MTGTTSPTSVASRLSLSQAANTPSALAMRFAGIPNSKTAEPVVERPAPADLPTAETAFRHATIKYQSLYDELLAKLEEGTATPEEQRSMVINVHDAEMACYEALRDLTKLHPEGKTIMRYCAEASAFAMHVSALIMRNINPLDPGNRRRTKDSFDQWKFAELPYANLGFKTISIEDFLYSVPIECKLHKAFYPQLLVKLAAGEDRVLHALDYQRKTPKLQIAGGTGSKSRNNKKR